MRGADRPLLAVTLGDPAGIGPEIVARTLADAPEETDAHAIAFGDAAVLRRAVTTCELAVEVRSIQHPDQANFAPGTIEIVDQSIVADNVAPGVVSEVAGRAAIAAIEAATAAAMAKQVDAVVTAPINKEAIWAAGSDHLGHTEMLGALTGSDRYQTMFVVDGLKIFFTTRHVSLREAIEGVTYGSVLHAIEESWIGLRALGHDEPRLAVAALNPHAGEGGVFGSEEIEHIEPALQEARRRGIGAVGPVPADAVFHQGLEGRYDAVLSHFHDQGHIAAKTWDFEGAVTLTLGLPIVRTSVDHGTAYDIAGEGIASHRGMAAAYAAAIAFSRYRDTLAEVYGTQP